MPSADLRHQKAEPRKIASFDVLKKIIENVQDCKKNKFFNIREVKPTCSLGALIMKVKLTILNVK